MKVLIVGGGGREHALAWRAAQSGQVKSVYVAPGNAGTAMEPGITNIAVNAEDIEGLVTFARDEKIDLTIIGPEAPLVAGVVNAFNRNGLRCFGPTAEAAILEGSKSFTKEFLKRHHIPTADYEIFTDIEPAIAYIEKIDVPVVIKADGLAGGKGVIIAKTRKEAVNAVQEMLAANRFGAAGQRVVIEELLEGEEASFIVVSDGKNVLPLASSQDHKARDDGDNGPNTGGMGAYSPAPVVSSDIEKRILREVIEPTLAGLRREGVTYRGFLYAGLMITANGTPRVIEYNCRMGDPETQPIMVRLKSDLVNLCEATIEGRLSGQNAEWDTRAALGVVMAAGGYPAAYEKGAVIDGIPKLGSDTCKVFHAGTAMSDERIVTSGGRVLCVVGLGNSVAQARDVAYDQVSSINWNKVYFRNDIGHRAIARERG